ncbi:hypothetical protein AB2N04_19755 [Nitratireductor sp. GISD-1A_MAKvit]
MTTLIDELSAMLTAGMTSNPASKAPAVTIIPDLENALRIALLPKSS